MAEKRAIWDNIPRRARGAVLLGLGLATSVVVYEALPDGTPSHQHHPGVARESGRYAVGATCVNPLAVIIARQSGRTVTISCLDLVTTEDFVTSLVNLPPDHPSASVLGYNGIVDFSAPGDSISFVFDGQQGVATAYTAPPGSTHNSSEVGIARPPAGFASNSNSTSTDITIGK